jgi:hypothetical protein
MKKKTTYPISECMTWTLDDETLEEAIVDQAEKDLDVTEEEGSISVFPVDKEFVAEFAPAES